MAMCSAAAWSWLSPVPTASTWAALREPRPARARRLRRSSAPSRRLRPGALRRRRRQGARRRRRGGHHLAHRARRRAPPGAGSPRTPDARPSTSPSSAASLTRTRPYGVATSRTSAPARRARAAGGARPASSSAGRTPARPRPRTSGGASAETCRRRAPLLHDDGRRPDVERARRRERFEQRRDELRAHVVDVGLEQHDPGRRGRVLDARAARRRSRAARSADRRAPACRRRSRRPRIRMRRHRTEAIDDRGQDRGARSAWSAPPRPRAGSGAPAAAPPSRARAPGPGRARSAPARSRRPAAATPIDAGAR